MALAGNSNYTAKHFDHHAEARSAQLTAGFDNGAGFDDGAGFNDSAGFDDGA